MIIHQDVSKINDNPYEYFKSARETPSASNGPITNIHLEITNIKEKGKFVIKLASKMPDKCYV
jgi:hypothetical protein